MKLARANLFIVRHSVSDWAGQYGGQPNSNGMRRRLSNRISAIRRPAGRLVAQWHVCPRTQRLECSWSLEAAASDGQLWRYPMQRRRGRTRRLLMQLSICNQRPLSQIRNRAL
jgi:hypothetical protein